MKLRAFTLIELMIVVAVFAIISAILIPNFIKARQLGQERRRAAQERPAAKPPAGGELSVLSQGRVELRLTTQTRQIGLDAVNGYQVTHQGVYHVSPASSGPTRLEFPFPRDASEIREARLQFLVDGRGYEPEGAFYSAAGAVWVGQLPPGLEQVQLSFVAGGEDLLIYELPVASRLSSLEVALTGDLSRARVAPWSLQPTETTLECLCWRFDNLVSRLPIALQLTPSLSPVAQVGTLFRLTGVAVLLFGLGLWYLGEVFRPGALANFRLGGFFLLALSYSIFFVVFAVLGYHQDVSVVTAFWVALACWAPPLALHTAHVVDRSFALRLALPLGLVTLLLVINGVYGGEWRDYVYLAAAVGTVAFLTTTYQRWLRIQAEGTARLADEVSELRSAYRHEVEQARGLLDRSTSALARPDPKSLRVARRTTQELTKTFLAGLSAPAVQTDLWGLKLERSSLTERRATLASRTEELERALARLEQQRQALGPLPEQGCCLACGSPGMKGKYCAACGQPAAEKIQCGACQTTVMLPPQTMQGPIHCPGCGLLTASGKRSQP